MESKNSIKLLGMQNRVGDTGRCIVSNVFVDNTHYYKCVKVKDTTENYQIRKALYQGKKLEPKDI